MNRPFIMVIDDDRSIRELIAFGLGERYEVRTAEDGEEALTLIRERIPDLIISDVMMPKIDGFNLCTALRQNPSTRSIPFIALTAKNRIGDLEEGFRAGVDDYMVKPFSLSDLRVHVARLLEKHASGQNNPHAA